MTENDSEFIRHIPCDNCGSSDANSLYTDGHTFCFSCNTHKNGDGSCSEPSEKRKPGTLISGSYQDLAKRKIKEETCRKFGYQVGEYKGKTVQIAPYYDASGTLVA